MKIIKLSYSITSIIGDYITEYYNEFYKTEEDAQSRVDEIRNLQKDPHSKYTYTKEIVPSINEISIEEFCELATVEQMMKLFSVNFELSENKLIMSTHNS